MHILALLTDGGGRGFCEVDYKKTHDRKHQEFMKQQTGRVKNVSSYFNYSPNSGPNVCVFFFLPGPSVVLSSAV